MSSGLLRDMSHPQMWSRWWSASHDFSERGTWSYVNGLVETGLLATLGSSMASEANVMFLLEGAICRQVGLRKCMKPYTLLTQSSNSGLYSELSFSSPSCWGYCERLLGPCHVPGTWMRVKWKRRIEMIQQLTLANGVMSGFDSIPLIYRVLTSTIRFQVPIRYIFSKHSERKRP